MIKKKTSPSQSLSIRFGYVIGMCEMIDEIEIEHLRAALARARKEMQEPAQEEEPLVAVA